MTTSTMTLWHWRPSSPAISISASESTAKIWATNVQGRESSTSGTDQETRPCPSIRPPACRAFVYNTRRPVFSDPQVRKALAYAFDFQWTNDNLFYGQYSRTDSYFENSELANQGLPSPAETSPA